MRNRVKKKRALAHGKVTIGNFFKMQINIIRELYEKHKIYTIGIIVFSGITMCTSFIELKLLEFVTNQVSKYFKGYDGIFFKCVLYIGLFFGLLLVIQITSNLYNIISEKYKSMIMFDVEKSITNKLADIPYEYYEESTFYEKMKLANQASEQYPDAVYGVTQIARIIVLVIVYGIMLSRINFLFIIMIFVSIAVSTVVAINVTDKQVDFWRTNVSPQTRRNMYFRDIMESRVNHQNIQTGRSFAFFGEKYTFYNNRERDSYVKLNILSFLTEISASLMYMIAFLFTAIYVGKGVVSGKFEIGNLRYQYPQSNVYALNGITISFQMGEKIAVVGYNGSGKSTLISVILGLLKNYEGSYHCSGVKCAAVLQDFAQYQMSIKENIEIGCGGKNLDDNTLNQILKDVGLYDVVSAMSEGINTKLGQLDNGTELSKGQWQRIAIGRLLADKDANVWILDEPTAYLDPIAEIEMYQLIYSLAKDRLVFFISHRLGFAKNADKIIVVNGGKIVENGSHRELREKKGLYSQMFDMQRSWYE